MLNEEFEKFLNVLKTVDIETRIHNARHLKFGYFNMMLFEKEAYKKTVYTFKNESKYSIEHKGCFLRIGTVPDALGGRSTRLAYTWVYVQGSESQVRTTLVPDDYSKSKYKTALYNALVEGIDEFTLQMYDLEMPQ